ncbi:hypothetical protein ABS71_15790 [bacterium SCN 62-11]|nr:hypothetical protein [Candidatus Eremiobacteraeota bacterium]ODT62393.1 MAG: hypothetical protein ABS71_15790 [bacterium SCN 62-11]
MFRRLASVVLGLALLSGVALADTTAKISMAELRTKGIDTRNFSVFHVAGDGRTILASDEPDFTLKKKGILRRLFLIKLTPALKIESVKKYDLPIPKIEQANFTPDLQSVVISSKRGSDIHKLDLGDGKLSPIMTHSPGTAGFRIHGDVFSNYGGKLYTVGYFYDENDVAEKDVMAEVNPTLTGKAAFTQLVEIAPIQRQLNGIRTESLLSPQGMLFYTADKTGEKWGAFRWSPSKGVELIDKDGTLIGSWGEGPFGVYCMKRTSGYDVTLINAQTGQKTPIYQGSDSMMNPCLSNEGNTVVLSHANPDKSATYWVAQDTDGYKPRKIGENLAPATTRISHDGQVICLYQGSKGLVLIKLDPPK